MIFASFLNFINLWADTCFLSTLQTRTLMLSEVAIYPSSGKDGGSLQMQVCVTQISAMSRVQPLWTNRTYRMAIDSFSCVSFSVNHLDFFFSFGNCVSSALCPDNSGEADPHPQGPGMGAWPRPGQSEHSDSWPESMACGWLCDQPGPGRTMRCIPGTLNEDREKNWSVFLAGVAILVRR